MPDAEVVDQEQEPKALNGSNRYIGLVVLIDGSVKLVNMVRLEPKEVTLFLKALVSPEGTGGRSVETKHMKAVGGIIVGGIRVINSRSLGVDIVI